MTPEEIRKSYTGAKDRKKQITILADLNMCKKQDIIELLRKEGVLLDDALLPKKVGRPPKAKPQQPKAESPEQLREPEPEPKPVPAPLPADRPRPEYTPLVIEEAKPAEQPPQPHEPEHALAEAVEALAEQVRQLRAERDRKLKEARAAEMRIKDMYAMLQKIFVEEGKRGG